MVTPTKSFSGCTSKPITLGASGSFFLQEKTSIKLNKMNPILILVILVIKNA